MKVEFNLVRTQSIYGNSFGLVARTRVEVTSIEVVMTELVKFITDNIDIFDAGLSDKSLVNSIQNMTTLGNDEFMSLKFMLAGSGLDILVWGVGDAELNVDSVAEGTMEYNIVDEMYNVLDWINLSTKIEIQTDTFKISDVFAKMATLYNIFDGPLFSDFKDPILGQLQVLQGYENKSGTSPNAISSYIGNVFNYLGKKMMIIHL